MFIQNQPTFIEFLNNNVVVIYSQSYMVEDLGVRYTSLRIKPVFHFRQNFIPKDLGLINFEK